MFDDDVFEIRKNRYETLIVKFKLYEGFDFFTLGLFTYDEDGQCLPASDLITMSVAQLSELKDALIKAEKVALRSGMI